MVQSEHHHHSCNVRQVWTYQRRNQKLYIDKQTTQWPKDKEQKDKQRKLKIEQHESHSKPGRTQVIWMGKQFLLQSWRPSVLVTNPVISHEWGKDRTEYNLSSPRYSCKCAHLALTNNHTVILYVQGKYQYPNKRRVCSFNLLYTTRYHYRYPWVPEMVRSYIINRQYAQVIVPTTPHT